MNDIEQKALARTNEVRMERGWDAHTIFSRHNDTTCEALCRAIEQHEAFKQEVSDIVHHYVYVDGGPDDWEKLTALIIPKPKPDPLEDVLEDICIAPHYAKIIRAALGALGFEIREKNDE